MVAFANEESYIECSRYETVFKTVDKNAHICTKVRFPVQQDAPLAYAALAD